MLNSIAFSRDDVSVNPSHGVGFTNRMKLALLTVVAIGAVFFVQKDSRAAQSASDPIFACFAQRANAFLDFFCWPLSGYR